MFEGMNCLPLSPQFISSSTYTDINSSRNLLDLLKFQKIKMIFLMWLTYGISFLFMTIQTEF